ncbi:MAG: GDP-mannose pyrophosphatase [Roseivivax sp.]|nr:GDP-mannose pyrophosphatase [Roseivivax sp.]
MSLKDRVQILDKTVLADDWAVLTKYTVRYTRRDGSSQTLPRETYDRGNGATILPYDPDRGTVLLGRQFRLTAYLNGHDDLLIEAAAGLLDQADPVTRIKAETEEELGLRLTEVRQIWDAFMSPGSVTERLFFFVGRYSAADRVSQGGGLEEEGEEIDVLELPIAEALDMVDRGAIRDGKTIMLLQYAALHLFKR